jgi:signal transduction histidine kinase
MKGVSQNINVDCQILSAGKFQRLYRSLDRLVYFYAGFLLLISLISLAGGLVFKRKALLIYTGYVVALGGWILAHYGYLFPELYPSFPVFNGIIKQVSTLVSMVCLLNLITVSFKAQLNKKWIQKTFLFLKGINALLITFYLVYIIGAIELYHLTVINVLWNVSLLLSLCFIITVLAALIKTSRTAKLFSVAIGLVSLMSIFQSVSNMGWLYNYYFNEHGMLVATLLEMLLLTFAIFFNLWDEKKQKEQELKIAEEERSKVLQTLITVQDEERRRIAGDLHDSIGPMLAAIKINFLRMARARAEKMASEDLVLKTENIIDESIAEIRNISHRLMPKGLSSQGLITLLNDYFTNLEMIYTLRIHFTHEINIALEKEVQLNLYRMLSELSLNAAKHSEANTLAVSIKTLPEETVVFMKDDGKGFSKQVKDIACIGIENVKSRIDYLKGTMRIESFPGEGTAIEIRIPRMQVL